MQPAVAVHVRGDLGDDRSHKFAVQAIEQYRFKDRSFVQPVAVMIRNRRIHLSRLRPLRSGNLLGTYFAFGGCHMGLASEGYCRCIGRGVCAPQIIQGELPAQLFDRIRLALLWRPAFGTDERVLLGALSF